MRAQSKLAWTALTAGWLPRAEVRGSLLLISNKHHSDQNRQKKTPQNAAVAKQQPPSRQNPNRAAALCWATGKICPSGRDAVELGAAVALDPDP